VTDAHVAHGTATAATTVLVGKLFRVRKGHEKRFEKEPPKEPEKRPARIALQLALAYRIQGAIDTGELKDQAEAAQLLGLTRARVTQLLDLTLLAPDIQERLLTIEAMGLTERALRAVSGIEDWNGQRRARTEIGRVRMESRSREQLSRARAPG
jgi:predicted XRE-type DNA-binding protein